jgi:hypothetical protein
MCPISTVEWRKAPFRLPIHSRPSFTFVIPFRFSRHTNMTHNTPMQQFEQGAETIHQALRTEMNQRGIPPFHIARTVEGSAHRPQDSTFIVATKDKKTESLMFTREEITDSARSIDAFAAAKVRVLVSRFPKPQ